MTTTAGPREVLAAARRARAEVASVVAGAGGGGSVAQWAQVVGELQALVDVATAVQDSAVVALAAVETEVDEDGTLVEVRHAPGHVALDAPAVISGVLCVSAVHAERRVREAVRVAADGPEGTPASTGLGGLHVAMGDGRLDPYRAQVLAHELDEAPAQVARVVVDALEAWFEQEDATRLRRRCRRLLARICPDLLRQRAVRARSESGPAAVGRRTRRRHLARDLPL
ncbi:hypothetical protein [Phycicoccus sonneratiae]|uniref:DUF222 domain-containing protein n=1 Tax=Phycicoccus sonneratiae TaxID=2807628 RepID=A0ABS2CJD5_9MICO|nr:hypothetical protein [Phycicoccus sonneraticus]MBM6399953.1 hypothetical protein [Phycicoccus sonneraticus]